MCIRHTPTSVPAQASIGAGRGERRDIVDHRRARRDRRAHHRRLARVDGDDDALAGKRRDERDHPRELLVLGDRRRARPRRFAADVDDVGAVVLHRPRVRERTRRIDIPAAVGERIGRDVEHAHHERPREVERVAAAAKPIVTRTK